MSIVVQQQNVIECVHKQALINIVIDDFSESFEKDFKEDTVFQSNHYQSVSTFFRFALKYAAFSCRFLVQPGSFAN